MYMDNEEKIMRRQLSKRDKGRESNGNKGENREIKEEITKYLEEKKRRK